MAMKPHVAYTYWMVCLRCYEVMGPCPDSLEVIARRTGYNKRIVSDALNVLFKTEKLVRVLDGIMNPYAEAVILDMRNRHETMSHRGRKGAAQRWEKTEQNQQNGDASANAQAMLGDAHLHLQVTNTEERKKEKRGRASRSAPQVLLPEDWILSAADRDYARQKGFSDSRIDQELQNFKNHHIGHQTKWARWDLAWHTWINNEIKWAQSRRKNNGSTTTQRPTRDEAIVAGVVRVAHQLVGDGYNRWADQKVPTNSDTDADHRRALEYRGPNTKN